MQLYINEHSAHWARFKPYLVIRHCPFHPLLCQYVIQPFSDFWPALHPSSFSSANKISPFNQLLNLIISLIIQATLLFLPGFMHWCLSHSIGAGIIMGGMMQPCQCVLTLSV